MKIKVGETYKNNLGEEVKIIYKLNNNNNNDNNTRNFIGVVGSGSEKEYVSFFNENGETVEPFGGMGGMRNLIPNKKIVWIAINKSSLAYTHSTTAAYLNFDELKKYKKEFWNIVSVEIETNDDDD